MESWIEIVTTIDTVNSKGDAIQVHNVKAFKDPKTGEVMVYPSEVAKAEIDQIAESLGLCPRDVGTLIMILAKPGNFNEGDVFYKYHLQKMMFILWKQMEKVYADSLPQDHFIAADNGPVPECLNSDLDRFEQNKLIRTKYEKTEYGLPARRIILTEKGKAIAQKLMSQFPDQYQEVILEVKKWIYPKTPEQVRDLIHTKYPEYRDTYVKNDIE